MNVSIWSACNCKLQILHNVFVFPSSLSVVTHASPQQVNSSLAAKKPLQSWELLTKRLRHRHISKENRAYHINRNLLQNPCFTFLSQPIHHSESAKDTPWIKRALPINIKPLVSRISLFTRLDSVVMPVEIAGMSADVPVDTSRVKVMVGQFEERDNFINQYLGMVPSTFIIVHLISKLRSWTRKHFMITAELTRCVMPSWSSLIFTPWKPYCLWCDILKNPHLRLGFTKKGDTL